MPTLRRGRKALSWHIRAAALGSESLEGYLADGWEPFAVDGSHGHRVVLRKQLPAGTADHKLGVHPRAKTAR